jgi:hypothetical protein|tara:strand:- start:711 stop:977 length:267 start_codon:yes stop_codon:yes gene_type:complete
MSNSQDWRNPSHYQKKEWEAIDIIRSVLTPEQFSGYMIGNELKYLLRINDKDTPEMNHGKVNWYNSFLEDLLEKNPELKQLMQKSRQQ